MLGRTRKSQLTFGEHSDPNIADDQIQIPIQPPIWKKEKSSTHVKCRSQSISDPSSSLSKSVQSKPESSQLGQKSPKIKACKHGPSDESNGNVDSSHSGRVTRNKASSGSESNKYESITTTKKSNTQAEPCPICVSRVTASSKVNFSKLMDEEKELRFKNMSKEIKHLRRKLRSLDSKIGQSTPITMPVQEDGQDKPEEIFLLAQEYLLQRKKKLEIEESANLLRTLAELIVERKEVISTLEFSIICSIIRKLKSPNPQKQVTLTIAQVNFFNSNSKDAIIRTLIGGAQQPSIKREIQTQSERKQDFPSFKLPPLKQQMLGTPMPLFPQNQGVSQPLTQIPPPQPVMPQPQFASSNAQLPPGCVIYMPPGQSPFVMNKVPALTPLGQAINSPKSSQNYGGNGSHTNQFVGLNAGMLHQFNQETQSTDGRQNKEGYIIENR